MRSFYSSLLIYISLSSLVAQEDNQRLKLLFAGDVMQHTPQIAAARNPETGDYDYRTGFSTVAPLLREADLTLANLEVTLAGPPYKGYPQFSAPDALADGLKWAGVDVLVTANNHSCDRGKEGIVRTLDVLDQKEMAHTGTFRNQEERDANYPLILEKKGFRLALLNYTYGTNGITIPYPTIVNLIDTQLIAADMDRAKERNVDAIIVFMHWGKEYQLMHSGYQRSLAEFCLQKGATLVIGSHPHVVQPMLYSKNEQAENQLVVYSLGNFVSNQRNTHRDGGMVAYAELQKNEEGKAKLTDAGYYLTWVYKTPKDPVRTYYILPAFQYLNDQEFIGEPENREKLETFLSETHPRLQKESSAAPLKKFAPASHWTRKPHLLDPTANRYLTDFMNELTGQSASGKPQPLAIYRIQIFVSKLANKDFNTLAELLQTDWLKVTGSDGLTRYQLGSFATRKEAERMLKRVQKMKDYRDAFIVTQ